MNRTMSASRNDWSATSRFAAFWLHYEAAEKWRRKHQDMVRESQNIVSCNMSSPAEQVTSWQNAEATMHNMDSPMELDADYEEFTRITKEHQTTRALQRNLEEENNKSVYWISVDNEDYVLADKIGVNGVQLKTIEDPNEKAKVLKKREEAREMYGDAAEKLMAMETALDVSFNEAFNKLQPPLWPNIQLRF